MPPRDCKVVHPGGGRGVAIGDERNGLALERGRVLGWVWMEVGCGWVVDRCRISWVPSYGT